MVDIATVTTAYEGLKTGKSILQSLYKTKVEADAKEKIEILQDNRNFSGEYGCVSCNAKFPINPRQNIPQDQATSEW